MNRKKQLIIDFRDYRRDGKGRRVKSSSLSIFIILFTIIKKNLQFTLDETVFMS